MEKRIQLLLQGTKLDPAYYNATDDADILLVSGYNRIYLEGMSNVMIQNIYNLIRNR
jgi:hypothetical protein